MRKIKNRLVAKNKILIIILSNISMIAGIIFLKLNNAYFHERKN